MRKFCRWLRELDWDMGLPTFLFMFGSFIMGAVWVISLTENRQVVRAAETPKEESEVSLFQDFKDDAIQAEGRVMRVYRDSEGNLTAGIGHLLTGEEEGRYLEGTAVTKKQVNEWFDKDFSRTMFGVAKHFPEFHTYPHVVKLAILNWQFQLGADAPLKFPLASDAIRKKDWRIAALEWEYADIARRRKSLWFHETPSRCMQEVHRLQYAADEEERLRQRNQ